MDHISVISIHGAVVLWDRAVVVHVVTWNSGDMWRSLIIGCIVRHLTYYTQHSDIHAGAGAVDVVALRSYLRVLTRTRAETLTP